jgi:ATP-dependent protease ClpP protease subunit
MTLRGPTKKKEEIMPKKFWQFRNAAGGGAELLLYGEIAGEKSWFGDEVTPKEFANELAKWGETDEITVRINSGGGDVFAAQAIGNILEAHKGTVTATIDGVCASAATIVACHCDKVVAANDSTYMVHPVRMGLYGYADAAELQQYIDAINTIRENIISLYAKKTGREKDEVAGWMDATSWWTGPQAKENGFVDELTDEAQEAVVENRGGVLFVNAVNMGFQFSEAPDFVRNSLAAAANKKPAGQPEKNQGGTNMGNEIKTVDDLRKAYPALVDQIEQAAGEAATKAERERIQGIEDAALPGAEELTNEAKFTKPMSVSDYAVALVKNAKAQGASYLAETQENAQSSGVNGVKNAPPVGLTDGDEFLNAIQGLGKSK